MAEFAPSRAGNALAGEQQGVTAPGRPDRGGGAAGAGRVQVGEEDAPGHAVHGEVVHDDDEPVRCAVGGTEQGGAQQFARPRVEFIRQPPGQRGRVLAVDLLDDGPHRAAGQHLQAVVADAEAQCVVVVEHGPHTGGQAVEGESVDPQGGPLRVSGDGVHVRVGVEQAAHDGRRGYGPGRLVDRLGRVLQQFGGGGQGGEAAACQQVARAQAEAHGPQPAADGDRGDAVAAEGEEVVVHTDPFDFERLGEDGAEQPLAFGAGLPAAAGRHGCGQGGAVEFAVGGDRQSGQHHHRRGHQVVGQPPGEVGAYVVAGDGGGHDVADQPGRAHGGRRGRHPGYRGEGRLDLAGLDTVPPDLDLPVAAARVGESAAGHPARQVAGAVHPLARRAEGVGDEAVGGGARPAEVAAGKVRSGQVQLAGRTVRDRLKGTVEHVAPGAGERVADRRRAVVDPGGGGVDGRLGGPVHVARGGPRRGDPLPQGGRGGLPAEDQQGGPQVQQAALDQR